MKHTLHRFGAVICEVENIKLLCPNCKTALKKSNLPLEGIGNNAVLPMLYCKLCDNYFIAWSVDDE